MYIRSKAYLSLLAGAAILLPALAFDGVADAQATERYQQGINRGPAQPVRLTPQAAADGSKDETELVSTLKGVIIVHDPSGVNQSGVSGSGVVSDPETVPAGVNAAAATFVGSPVSFASLDQLTRAMVIAYRKAGRPVVNVVVPPQDISNGVLQIIAVVGRLGEVKVEGETSNPEYYTEGFGLIPGDIIEEGAVLDQLRWKSRRAHRRVNAIYEPGSKFSLTNISFDVTETKPWSVFVGADNTGSKGGNGEYRFFTGFIVGDLWGLDHELSYQFTTSEELYSGLGAHVLSYTLPVASRTDFQAYGSYVTSSSEAAAVTASGESYQIGGHFITQVPRFRGISADVRYGFVYKSSDNDTEFGGNTVFANKTGVSNFYAQLTGNYSWAPRHRSNFSAGVWAAPGGIFGHNDDASISASRTGASANYIYLRSSSEHVYEFKNDVYVSLELQSQWTQDRLPTSEMFYLGGLNTIRGFDENAVRGDKGTLARFEVYTPRMMPMGEKATERFGAEDSLRFYGFFDVGHVDFNGTASGTRDLDTTIGGLGVGFTYQIGNKVSLEAAYGWNVIDDDNAGDDGQFHFRALRRF